MFNLCTALSLVRSGSEFWECGSETLYLKVQSKNQHTRGHICMLSSQPFKFQMTNSKQDGSMDQDWNYIQIQNKLLWMADLVITDRNDANCKFPLRFLIPVFDSCQISSGEMTFERFGSNCIVTKVSQWKFWETWWIVNLQKYVSIITVGTLRSNFYL